MSASNRGRYAEGKVREFLKKWAEAHAHFCFNRILDAHSAMGAMANPQPGDFQWFLNTGIQCSWVTGDGSIPRVGELHGLGFAVHKEAFTRNGLIEVKETEHPNRLSYKNFAVDQVGRMRIRQLAGSEPLVIVCHRVNGKTYWRAPDFEFFEKRDPARPSGSWDLTDIEPVAKVDLILEAYLK